VASVVAHRFGEFVVDPVSFRLLRNGQPVSVTPKIVDLLLYLVARPSTLVTKEELFKALWPDVAVTDNALTQAVSELRQALGDDPAAPKYVQTVARRGYRFIATVQADLPPSAPPPAADADRDTALTTRTIAVTDFANVTGDLDYAWLSPGIAETVTNDLRSLGALRIIDRVRVLEAVRRTGGSLSALRSELVVDLAVVGSFQRAGERVRITARVVDVATGEALADAKADGPLADVFDVQDQIVAQFAEKLGLSDRSASPRAPVRETTNLEAYQAFTEARVKLESLESALVPAAIGGFERAIALDPRYAAAYVGLANARFWQYETSRARNQPDAGLLARAIDDVRRAIELDKGFAEAHATLGFLLVGAGRTREALAVARRAVQIEPQYWAHQFRLGHAAWGEERLRALARARELYPDFPFAHFEAAMVHIARGALDRAEQILREGAVVQDRQAGQRQRYPARGLHWLLGLTRLARGDRAEALAEFDREIAGGAGQLYAAEFTMNSYDGRGFVFLQNGQPGDAAGMFRRALERYPGHARSRLGLAAALKQMGLDAAEAEFTRARTAIEELRRGGRGSEATLAEAFEHAVLGRDEDAVASLHRLLDEAEQPFAGWTVPIEPFFAPLADRDGFRDVIRRLADRARQ
jgi:DNA-binding winged helix-turn-helix (wHTH) protein/tetratricopeptide (TPR) repeat protein